MLNKEKIISEFNLVPSGNKGWHISTKITDLKCLNCGSNKPGKLAFIFGNVEYWKCVKCGEKGRLSSMLWKVGRRDLVPKYKDVSEEAILKKQELINNLTKEIDLTELPECLLPFRFERVEYSNYLNSRGCDENIYNNWLIGKTSWAPNLKNFIIFVVKENDKIVGWVARSLMPKKYIDDYNRRNRDSGKYMLRWRNSEGDFSKMVFGIDEINENTETLIIVEGITSKMNTDVQLKLYNDDYMKCVCTFGKKIDPVQIHKIINKGKNINTIILMYDLDAIKSSKGVAFRLSDFVDNVFVAIPNFKNDDGSDKDAGDLTLEEFNIVFDNMKRPFDFYNSVLEKKKLT